MKAKVTVKCVLRQYKLMVQWDLGVGKKGYLGQRRTASINMEQQYWWREV